MSTRRCHRPTLHRTAENGNADRESRVKASETTQGSDLRCGVLSVERVLFCNTEVLDEEMSFPTMSDRNYHFVESFTLCMVQK